ncbi:MAG: NAD(P)-binding domain-containing protein [bacterium]|nr:NAD(P)-binding domain-containing protein [bacterium]
MKIGILGSGSVAQTLAAGFVSRGHDVMLGTRDAKKLAQWQADTGAKASVGSFADAAAYGEVIVLATLGTATLDVIGQIGAAAFAGKTVMDATNPLSHDGGELSLTLGFSDSLGEQIQRAIPDAHVVKVYNSVGAPLMVDPKLPGGPPDMFIAGNDAQAKQRVTTIVEAFGWGVVDAGGIEAARLLEPLCILWVDYGVRTGTWNHAFKLLRG